MAGSGGYLLERIDRDIYRLLSRESNAYHVLFENKGKAIRAISEVRSKGFRRQAWDVPPGQYFLLEYRKDGRGVHIEEITVNADGKSTVLARYDLTDIPVELFVEMIHCYFIKPPN